MTPDHCAGTLGDEWIPWIEGEGGIALRPWQRHVLNRVLEVDSDGRLIWDEAGITTPRQSGKSWFVRAISVARCHFSEHFEEPQECAYLANNLVSAKRVMRRSWRWAEENGLVIRQAMGDERMLWDTGAMWFLSSLRGIYGASASLAMVDECWDVSEDEVREGVQPIVIERDQSQLILLSTANELASPLFLNYRKSAMEGAAGRLLLEWSAGPDDDPDDPEVWRAASPHWSDRRERLIAGADRKSRRYQYLNVWPDSSSGLTHWLGGWDGLRPSEGPFEGCVGAVEVASDRSCVGAAVAVARDGGKVDVATYICADLPQALEWLGGHSPWLVLAGVSIKNDVEAGGSWITRPAGVRESGLSTPWLAAAVREKRLRHDHREGVSVEVARSATSETEGGVVLSAKRSAGPIPAIKSVAWAGFAAATEPAVMPAIW